MKLEELTKRARARRLAVEANAMVMVKFQSFSLERE